MERRTGFRPNHGPDGMAGILMSELTNDPAVHFAKLIMADAIESSPYDAMRDRKDRPHFVDSFHVDEHPAPYVTKNGNPHAGATVYNDAPHAPAVEFGNGKTQAHHTLRDAGAKYHHRIEED